MQLHFKQSSFYLNKSINRCDIGAHVLVKRNCKHDCLVRVVMTKLQKLNYRRFAGISLLKTKKKVWCVLEESQCQLMYYKSEEEFQHNKAPQGTITLRGAAITLDLENSNQFIIMWALHSQNSLYPALSKGSKGGILESTCPSVRLPVCLFVDAWLGKMVK